MFRKLDQVPLYLLALRWCWPLGFIAVVAGWTTTEVGRQPWVAHGVLRTADAASPIPAMSIAVFIALFVLVYGIVFRAGIRYIRRLIKKGPEPNRPTNPRLWQTGRFPRRSKRASQRRTWLSRLSGRSDPMESYLAVVWGVLLGFAIVMYVILDGFDLGIGILFRRHGTRPSAIR